MRIIAERKDYYDCVQAHGQDQTLIYVRKPEEIEYSSGHPGNKGAVWPFPSLYRWFSWDGDFGVYQHMVGFCGKIYPILDIWTWKEGKEKGKGTKCFNIEDVDKFVEEHFSKANKDKYFSRNQRRWRFRWGSTTRRHISIFFDDCQKKQDFFSEMFQEKRCPVFVATFMQRGYGRIVYNALLRPYDFVRIFDPYTAFQEISMFMGNMAMPEKEMPIIPDELKIQKRGFTDQSFRAPFKDDKRIPK